MYGHVRSRCRFQGGRRRKGTILTQGQKKQGVEVREVQQHGDGLEASPLYGVAMLKIAMELKKPEAKELDEILQGVLARMKIPEDDFRRFLDQNGGMLRTIANRKKF